MRRVEIPCFDCCLRRSHWRRRHGGVGVPQLRLEASIPSCCSSSRCRRPTRSGAASSSILPAAAPASISAGERTKTSARAASGSLNAATSARTRRSTSSRAGIVSPWISSTSRGSIAGCRLSTTRASTSIPGPPSPFRPTANSTGRRSSSCALAPAGPLTLVRTCVSHDGRNRQGGVLAPTRRTAARSWWDRRASAVPGAITRGCGRPLAAALLARPAHRRERYRTCPRSRLLPLPKTGRSLLHADGCAAS